MQRKPIMYRFVKGLVIIALLFIFVLEFILVPIRIVGQSMHPTLDNHQVGLTFILGKYLGIDRFDIVTVEVHGEAIIKRVVGLPNETIEYRNDQLYINGKQVDEPFLNTAYRQNVDSRSDLPFTYQFKEVQLKQDEYFVLGDNRPRSQDSRFFGPIKETDIVSKGFWALYIDD